MTRNGRQRGRRVWRGRTESRRGRPPASLTGPAAKAAATPTAPLRPSARADRGRGALRGRRVARAALVVVALGVAAWLAGLVEFASALPVAVADPGSRADAIVVLTGGRDRVATGLRLLAEDKGERLLVSGVHPGVNASKLIDVTAGAPMALRSRIDTGDGAQDTIGNARETAEWMRRHGFTSLRLVTANYHLPRALLEVQGALPEATIIPHPVVNDEYRPQTWWREWGPAFVVAKEHAKYVLARVRLALAPSSQPPTRSAPLAAGDGR